MVILWFLVVGTIAGIIAQLASPGPKTVSGFILFIVLSVVGSFVAALTWTFVGQATGRYGLDQGADYFISAPIGAFLTVVILIAWRTISDGRRKRL